MENWGTSGSCASGSNFTFHPPLASYVWQSDFVPSNPLEPENSRSGVIKEKYTHLFVEWIIDKFQEHCHCLSRGLKSPKFDLFNEIWCLSLEKNTEIGQSKNDICVYLNKEKYSDKTHRIAYRIGLKKNDDTIFACIENTDTFSNENRGTPFTFNMDACIKEEILKGNSLTIFCEANILQKYEEHKRQQEMALKGLSQNLKDLLVAGTGCDVKIRVKEIIFEAHRFILESRSSVFAAMFQNDMVEKRSGLVDIADCNPEDFRQFLLFLYSGQVEEMSNANVIGLYELSERYCIKDLKAQCSEFMNRNISLDMFCDFVVLAEIHQEPELLNETRNFFIENVKTILPTVKWEDFITKYPIWANELFKSYLM